MKNKMIIVGLTVFAGLNASAATDELVFVCHTGLNYAKNDVRMAFRGQLDEPHVVDNSSLKPKLLSFLGVDSDRYRKLWNRSFFRRALNQPQTKKSDAEVLEYVASHPEGVGYVSSAPSSVQGVEVCGK